VRRHLLPLLGLFVTALVVRFWLVQGLVLGDDAQEFGVLQHVLANGPDFRDQLQVRFGGWAVNYVVCWLLGVSESTVMLPSMLISSSFPLLSYVLLVRWGYARRWAFLAGLLVATAPFEVVLGTCRTNDLVLGGTLGLGFTALVLLERRPIWQGIVVALLLWFAFYVKLWAVYALPGLGLYAFLGRRWRAGAVFVATSVVIHGATLAYWKAKTGSYIPFIDVHAANYPVQAKDILLEWGRYPRMIFVGSEFGTTLFGIVPYALVLLFLWRLVRRRLDRADWLLFGFWGILFGLIEFFPAGFTLDKYYTVPRIFRYLAPISFPLSLHAAKLVVDTIRAWRPALAVATASALLVANVAGDIDATLPGRIHRDALFRIVHEIETLAPPRVVAEITLGYWLNALYLQRDRVETEVETPPQLYEPPVVEKWVRDAEQRWPPGTLLITGLGNYVHYGAHAQSLRLSYFDRPLDDRWALVGEYGILSFLPRAETARLWRLTTGKGGRTVKPPPDEPDLPPPPGELSSRDRLATAKELFDKNRYAEARAHYRVLIDGNSPEAEDARFFYAVSFHREEKWARAAHEFKHLRARFPHGRWVAAAHWHLALCDLRRGRSRRARARFAYIIRRFEKDTVTAANAQSELNRLRRRNEGWIQQMWRRFVDPTV
jgi:hypothetical protein